MTNGFPVNDYWLWLLVVAVAGFMSIASYFHGVHFVSMVCSTVLGYGLAEVYRLTKEGR